MIMRMHLVTFSSRISPLTRIHSPALKRFRKAVWLPRCIDYSAIRELETKNTIGKFYHSEDA
jgi:hypothetical protein